MTRQKIESELGNDLKTLQHNCRVMIDTYKNESDDQNKKFLIRVNKDIEVLTKDISEDLNKQDAHIVLQHYIDEDLPKIRHDLKGEIEVRKEMDEKIHEQFMSQIEDLHQAYQEDKKEREQRSQEFIQLLKKVSIRISNDVHQSKEEREQNTEMLFQLVEQVSEKIKRDAYDVLQ